MCAARGPTRALTSTCAVAAVPPPLEGLRQEAAGACWVEVFCFRGEAGSYRCAAGSASGHGSLASTGEGGVAGAGGIDAGGDASPPPSLKRRRKGGRAAGASAADAAPSGAAAAAPNSVRRDAVQLDERLLGQVRVVGL